MKKVLLFILLPLLLSAYSDNDLDGVEDKDDLCPNTSMTELVDNSGCTIERLIAPTTPSSSYDIIMGMGYSKNSSKKRESKTKTENLQLDYFYDKLSIQLQSSHFSIDSKNYDKSGVSDTYLGAYYRVNLADKLRLNFGARLNIPTYKSDLNNNNLDYTLSTSCRYQVDKFTLTAGLGYTFVNDDDINNERYKLNYQNSLNYHFGIGYFFMPRLYGNISYLNSTSIYKGYDDLSSASFYGHYSIDNHWFSTLSYTKGLSDEATDQSTSIRVGYYF